MAMKLTDGEKLILYMLSEIYENLGIRNGIDPKFVKSAICDGHAWGLKREYTGIFGIDEDDPAVVSEVSNILEMWLFLESSYDRLSDAAKARVATVPRFGGFGGNSKHGSVASFLIQKPDRFNEFKGREMYEYTPYSLQQQRAMLAVFTPMQSSFPGRLNADQITEILNARSTA
jgi:uncharacterized protein